MKKINWWNRPRMMDISVAGWITIIVSLSVAVLMYDFMNTGGTGVWVSW